MSGLRTKEQVISMILNKRDQIGQSGNVEEINQLEGEVKALEAECEAIDKAARNEAIETQLDLPDEEMTYILDTLETADGSKMIELSHTEEDYKLMRRAVQRAFLEHEEYWKGELRKSEEGYLKAVKDVETLTEENGTLNTDKHQWLLEKVDLTAKLENAAALIAEHERELKQQAATIGKLLETQAAPAEIKPLTADEEEAKWIAEKMGKRIKVTNIRLAHPGTFNTKDRLADNALTGEVIEFVDVYIKRYEEITEEAAQALRAEYAQKKADLEEQFKEATIEAPAIQPLEPIEELPEVIRDSFQEAEADGPPVDQGNANGEVEAETVGEAKTDQRIAQLPFDHEDRRVTEDTKLERGHFDTVTWGEFLRLEARVSALENSPIVLKGDEAA